MGNIINNINSPGSSGGSIPSVPSFPFNTLFTTLVVVNAGVQNATTNGVSTVIELAPVAAIAATTVNLVPANGTSFVTGELVTLTLAALANTVALTTITTSTGAVVIPSPSALLAVGTGSIRLQFNGTAFVAV